MGEFPDLPDGPDQVLGDTGPHAFGELNTGGAPEIRSGGRQKRSGAKGGRGGAPSATTGSASWSGGDTSGYEGSDSAEIVSRGKKGKKGAEGKIVEPPKERPIPQNELRFVVRQLGLTDIEGGDNAEVQATKLIRSGSVNPSQLRFAEASRADYLPTEDEKAVAADDVETQKEDALSAGYAVGEGTMNIHSAQKEAEELQMYRRSGVGDYDSAESALKDGLINTESLHRNWDVPLIEMAMNKLSMSEEVARSYILETEGLNIDALRKMPEKLPQEPDKQPTPEENALAELERTVSERAEGNWAKEESGLAALANQKFESSSLVRKKLK